MCALCDARAAAKAARPLGPNLGDEWDRYLASIMKPGLSPALLVEARRAFYSGAGTIMAMFIEAGERGDRPAVGRLVAEVKEVVDLMRRGLA